MLLQNISHWYNFTPNISRRIPMIYKYLNLNEMWISHEESRWDINISHRILMRCEYLTKNLDEIEISHEESRWYINISQRILMRYIYNIYMSLLSVLYSTWKESHDLKVLAIVKKSRVFDCSGDKKFSETFQIFRKMFRFSEIFRILENFQICGKLSDLWKIFRFVENFQICGKFFKFS